MDYRSALAACDAFGAAFGDRFEAIEIESKDSEPGPVKAHSVLTIDLQDRTPAPGRSWTIAFLCGLARLGWRENRAGRNA